MTNYQKLKGRDLKIDFELLPEFNSTSEILPYKDIIGQNRAIEAIDMGLSINREGYNIFVSGNNGTGRKNYVMNCVKDYAKKQNATEDWCYVFNFEENDRPAALSLKPGTSEEFKKDIEDLINDLFEEVPKFFSNESYEKKRNEIIEKFQKYILNLVDKLYDESKERGFDVKNTNDGFAFIPIKDGEEMSERQYNELSDEEKENINDKVGYLKLTALDVIRKSKIFKKEMNDALKMLDDENTLLIISTKIQMLKDKYGYNPKIADYLSSIQRDVMDNIDAFMDSEEADENYDDNFFKRYYVNIIVSNDGIDGAPVVFEDFPEYQNLIGKIEYENKSGTLVTDFTSIQPGSLHKANGGYLVIDAYQLLTSYQGWEALKRSLRSKTIFIENLKNQLEIIPIASLKPDEIPLNVKVILIGSPTIYYILYNYDEDFKELFKMKADFEDEIKNNSGTVMKFLGFLSNYCCENDILPLTRDGVSEIFKHSLRLAESRNYFSGSMRKVVDIMEQASSMAESRGNEIITDKHIREIIELNERRYGLYRDKVIEMYKEGKYLVEIKGYKIGEINGLSVIDFGDFSFGRQTRITVATFAGKDGIINIEREAKMSGNIHSKGIMILSGYIGQTFGQEMQLSFNASICFEQLYGEVDGDSASAAELIALLSSLGDIPIKQSIAVTGSVNQKGEIQPVGGINEKIEGYFEICKCFGLDGSQGVIIPYANVDELVLKDELIKEVEDERFHIYAVKSIEDCFEILCEDNFKRSSRKNTFESVKKRVVDKLKRYNNTFTETAKD